jgi:soluble lytic murein transglycosylase
MFFIVAFIILVLFIISNRDNIMKLNYPLKYKEHVYKYSIQNGLDPYLVFAIIKAESGFNPGATSNKNARGLMQISETTGKEAAEKIMLNDYDFNKLYDPETNIKLGCGYLKYLKDQFKVYIDSVEDEDNAESLVIAAYNGGIGNVKGWLKDKNLSVSGKSLDKIPFKETENFLKRVKNYRLKYKSLYENNF